MIESSELICNIGQWVISNACRLCKELQNNGFEDLTVAVNISSAQFARGGLEKIIIEETVAEEMASEESVTLLGPPLVRRYLHVSGDCGIVIVNPRAVPDNTRFIR